MNLKRTFRFRGKPRSYLSAGCPAPPNFRKVTFPLARASFAFAGGKTLTSKLNKTCVPR